jgi:ABC-type multidrug transport system fused ATPase/permease subunit
LSGRTALILSHRPKTISRCDRVVLLKDGKVLEQGGRSALQRDPASEFHQWASAEARPEGAPP